ncbi:MAG TPA: tetratricopeptide repeat-containing glycosyltransferase family protein [Steroidobacteraceae bacterium]|nr:tetratricopeptide repeat-containing glycosyltransferase family protein [Steroidobacteraceae bacterium]
MTARPAAPADTTEARIRALLQRAIKLHQAGNLAPARAIYEDILAIEPEHFDALQLSGVLAAQLGDPTQALRRYEQAIAIDARQAPLHCNKGSALCALGRWHAALACYDQALALQPGNAAAHFNRGNAFCALGRFDAALEDFERAVAIDGALAEAHSKRAHALCQLGRFEAAIVGCNAALALRPRLAEALCVRGNAERALDRLDAAVSSYRQAIAAQPDYPDALCNLGNVLRELEQLDAAIGCYDRAVEMHPDFAEGYFARSIALLLGGDYQRGWRDYEWRWRCRSGTAGERRSLRAPLWLGKETLADKTVLLHAEQGLGDSLQFCRYIGAVAERGARVILEVHQPLMRLLSQLPGVSQLIARGSELPHFDLHCPLMSLPLALGTAGSIPAPVRLRAEPASVQRWRNRLPRGGPRVGLVFSGSAVHPNDRHRSIPLADWIPHLPGGLQYIALQRDMRARDREVQSAHPCITSCGDELRDFADTAALCELLDLVICVDTSIAHLCGSMGVRTWLLLPFNPDWRWLLGRQDSPWYPSITLYRQRKVGDWREVLAQVGAHLCALRGGGGRE